jgi:hypothetical protein
MSFQRLCGIELLRLSERLPVIDPSLTIVGDRNASTGLGASEFTHGDSVQRIIGVVGEFDDEFDQPVRIFEKTDLIFLPPTDHGT